MCKMRGVSRTTWKLLALTLEGLFEVIAIKFICVSFEKLQCIYRAPHILMPIDSNTPRVLQRQLID